MKAVRISRLGDTSVLEYVNDQEKPKIQQPDHVLIQNKAIGVNFIDIYHRTGLYPVPLPAVLGREGAGIVVEAGQEAAKRFPFGTRVAYFGSGSYADFILMKSKLVEKLPDSVSFDQGAAALIQGLTALTMTKYAYTVKKGDVVLIHAVAGGTGSILCQVVKRLGATVIGTTSTQAKAAEAKAKGADHVILYKEQDVLSKVLEITQNQGVHVVYDGVGASTFDVSLSALRLNGTLVSFGNASGKVPPFDISRLGPKCIKVARPNLFGYCEDESIFREMTAELMHLLDMKQLDITVSETFPLKDAAKAQQALESGATVGKLLLHPE